MQSLYSSTNVAPGSLLASIRIWHRQARQSLGHNFRFVREQRNGFRVFRQRTAAAEAALQSLLPDPDRAFDRARILKPGSRTHAGVVEIAGARYVLKRYNCRGWAYRIGNAFRRSRAVRTWLVNWQYLVRGVPVPEPILCLEERRCRLLERSYILMEYIEETVSLRARWARLAAAEKECFGVFFGELLGRMHRVGMLHGDLKWDNILVGNQPSLETARLVDLDGSSASVRFNRTRAQKDFARFLKDLAKEEAGTQLRGCVTRAWEKALR